MSRRRGESDPDFGSDSFLDIIANIVGILIILIVIAGVKVARQPAVVAPDPVVATTIPAADFLDEDWESLQHEIKDLDDRLLDLSAEAGASAEASAELQSTEARLDEEVSSLRSRLAQTTDGKSSAELEIAASRAAAESLQQQFVSLQEEVESKQQAASSITADLQETFQRQKAASEEIQEVAFQTARLREVLTEHEQEETALQRRLRHRLSPVARTDSSDEIHFRLSDGAIAWLPLEVLLDRLKTQVMSRAGVIRKFGRYEGTCGPAGGFLMRYSVGRQVPSPTEVLNGRGGGYRIEVTRWTVVPSDTYTPETVSDALRSGSRFRQVVEAADTGATLTVWLYADEFPYFHDLREFAHRLDLRVAARPLPDGANISGSPGGSKSSAQ